MKGKQSNADLTRDLLSVLVLAGGAGVSSHELHSVYEFRTLRRLSWYRFTRFMRQMEADGYVVHTELNGRFRWRITLHGREVYDQS